MGARQSLRTMGIFLLVFAGPLLALRLTCVSYREVCEGVGGHYGAVPDVVHTCRMPNGDRACPRPYRWSESGEGCTARVGDFPVLARWQTW